MSIPTVGQAAPAFALDDQHGASVRLADFRGRHLLIYFYPKADTPGCTAQSCAVRDAMPDFGELDAAVVGISPDAPAKQSKFDTKYELGFPLLSDPEHQVAEAYSAWGTKSMYGRQYQGIIRSAFLVAPDGTLAAAWPKISPKDTVPKALQALQTLQALRQA